MTAKNTTGTSAASARCNYDAGIQNKAGSLASTSTSAEAPRHAAGPWELFRSKDDYEFDILGIQQVARNKDQVGHFEICRLNRASSTFANARLIASAPELLAQRDELLAALKSCVDRLEEIDTCPLDGLARKAKAWVAIARCEKGTL